MRKRIVTTASLLLLATPFCFAKGYTLDEANSIIVILIIIVIVLVVMGCYGLHYNKIISRRNEQMQRILTVLDEYRALVGDGVLTLDEQEEALKKKLQTKKAKVVQKDEGHNFAVMMDARVNKEKPFTDPDFDHDALVKFMGVSNETFCELVPRYKDPERTLDYINSLRAEYAAKLLMDHSDYSSEDIARRCGFRSTAAFNSAFKFAFGITPTDYLSGMSQMFKKKERRSS